ncbi:MAG TPA: hypothetical protein VGK02_01080 [Candidatus Aquicultor sp.]
MGPGARDFKGISVDNDTAHVVVDDEWGWTEYKHDGPTLKSTDVVNRTAYQHNYDLVKEDGKWKIVSDRGLCLDKSRKIA